MPEIVVTRSETCVLDIGLRIAPDKIRAKTSTFGGKWYGGSEETLSHFVSTGISFSESDWDKLTYNKSTKEVCDSFGIPYYNNQDSSIFAKLKRRRPIHIDIPSLKLLDLKRQDAHTIKFNIGATEQLLDEINRQRGNENEVEFATNGTQCSFTASANLTLQDVWLYGTYYGKAGYDFHTYDIALTEEQKKEMLYKMLQKVSETIS